MSIISGRLCLFEANRTNHAKNICFELHLFHNKSN